MVHPLVPMNIRGALWYQGEANSAAHELYKCQFKAMISDWRHTWCAATDGGTSASKSSF